MSTSATIDGVGAGHRQELEVSSARIRHAQPLTEESLLPLFERWQVHGDQHARDVLVERFQPLARSLARRYASTREPIDDLTQVAYLGLINAIDRFDTSRGSRFAAFAVPTILGELRRYFRNTAWAVHVPRGAQERALEVDRAGGVLTSNHGRAPSVGEIAEYLECDQEEVLDALQVGQARSAVSLDAPRPGGTDGDSDTHADAIGVEDDGYELVEDGSAVAHALSLLAPRERRILYLRFAQEMTQSEIAALVGISQMQISRVLRQSLERMRTIAEGAPPRP